MSETVTCLPTPTAQHLPVAHLVRPVDLVEFDDHFTLKMDVPGLTREDINVQADGSQLTISGVRSETTTYSGEHRRRERTFGRFVRRFTFGDNVNLGTTSAAYTNGVLTVTIPKQPSKAKHQIVVMSPLDEGDGSLNDDFKEVSISVFPTPSLGKLVIINSDTPIVEAAKILSEYRILSAPVRDVDQPDDAGWMDKYLGFIDMVSIVFDMLSELKGGDGEELFAQAERNERFRTRTVKQAMEAGCGEIFVPVDFASGTLLDCMLLCGNHRIHRVPVIETPGGDIKNIITQSALVQTLSANLERFTKVSNRTLHEVGLAAESGVVSARLSQTLREAFTTIKETNVSGLPILDDLGHVRGCLSARDVRLIIGSHQLLKLLDLPLSSYLEVVSGQAEDAAVTCNATSTLGDVVRAMVKSRVHRIFVVDDFNRCLRVVSLCDVLMKFCKEPEGYFGRFFM